MSRTMPLTMLAATLAIAGCNSNSGPGNDKERQLDSPTASAPKMGAVEALSGVATDAVQVETMSDADVAGVGGLVGKCTIRLTAIGFPSFLRDGAGKNGIIKLNGKLIPLRSSGDGLYTDGGLRVVLKPIEKSFGSDGMRKADMIVMLPDAKDELGYRAYEKCTQAKG